MTILSRRSARALLGAAAVLLVALLLVPPIGSGGGSGHSGPRIPPTPLTVAARGPTAYTEANVNYTSSVDGFALSYTEVLPVPFDRAHRYPLAIELHGLAASETNPRPGGYPTTVVPTTEAAAASAGFILIVPNTRTGAGWYVDSKYTGPQEQDVLDAIGTEQARRLTGPLYVYGFSMGSIGSVSIALDHPGMFAGAGGIATFSDLYETYAYFLANSLTSLINPLLLTTGGFGPQNTVYAQHMFDHLSVLRFHPENASHTRLYLANGGEDLLSSNNRTQWSYQQGNDSVLSRSCVTDSTLNEPANCTVPLAVWSVLDPANFSYRFVFEPQGTHDYGLLNATDLFAYFNGGVAGGAYWGDFPIPSLRAPPRPLVTLVSTPSGCGGFRLDTTVATDTTIETTVGGHSLTGTPCAGANLSRVATGGGLLYNATSGHLTVASSGWVSVGFAVPHYVVTISDSSPCPLTVNGTAAYDASSVSLFSGNYTVQAPACGSYRFVQWTTSGAVSVSSSTSATATLTVVGNGTLSAVYTGSPPPNRSDLWLYVLPTTCGDVTFNGTPRASGTYLQVVNGPYALSAPICPGSAFSLWSITGGISVATQSLSTTVTVSSSGTLSAVYTSGGPPVYQVVVSVSPESCGAVVVINGTGYANASSVLLYGGIYPVEALGCANLLFIGWTRVGAVDVSLGGNFSSGNLVVTGNGTVTANFGVLCPVTNCSGPIRSTQNDSGSFPLVYLIPIFAAAGVGVVATAVVLGRRNRGRTGGWGPADRRGGR